MRGGINFQIIEQESAFLDPRKDFNPTVEHFQIRIDPLTGQTGHFSHFGAIKPQKLNLVFYNAPEVKGFCPFCLENRDKATPKFMNNLIPEGRPTRNEACLIPNLFPYDIHSGVLIMTDPHVVPLEHFDEKRLRDAFSLGIEFLKRIRAIDPSLPYYLMTWNYMPPSGGGLVHPHQQYIVTSCPGNQFMEELKASLAFHKTYGVNYWMELLREEQEIGTRFIGNIGRSSWLTSFVSLGLLGDILCVFPSVKSIDEFASKDIESLVSGLDKVFKYYVSCGIYSFNASLFFGPERQDSFSSHFRIVPRTFLNMRDCASDLNFFQALLGEPVSVVMPEELCRDVKPYFQ
jgi:galactose-1-phosphate uridylyltransferase